MNILFSTQGSSLNFFWQVSQILSGVGKAGFYVSHARSFSKSIKTYPELKKIPILKEWEIVEQARKEKQSPDKNMDWSAAIADRRLTFGWKCTYIEDPAPRFDEEIIQSILTTAQRQIEEFWDEVKPDVLVGFVPVTFGEYLLVKHAEKLNVPILLLRSVRMKNFQALHDRLLGLSRHLQKLYDQKKFNPETVIEAQEILSAIQKEGLLYEGTLKRKEKTSFDVQVLKMYIAAKLREGAGALKTELMILKNSQWRKDHHDPGTLRPWFYNTIIKPMRKSFDQKYLDNHPRYFSVLEKLDNLGAYAFFPLHFEPEVAVQIYAQPYAKNQIGLIRHIAMSLPLGMKLVVKDHPRAIGYRSLSFYKELLTIPNLYIAEAELPAAPIVHKASLINVISGTLGLEAALRKKPVITFGHTEYAVLPENMLRFCRDLYQLPAIIKDLLDHYTYNEQAGLDYICALIEGSTRMDYYSLILGKAGRNNYLESNDHNDIRQKQLQDFANYMDQRIKNVFAKDPANLKAVKS